MHNSGDSRRGNADLCEIIVFGSAAHDVPSSVIPGRAQREPGIHNHDREYGFRARAKRRVPE